MRLNLNFKDANITKTSESEFRIVFDLSKMNKPRLSQDARMYIEHFNLPEFIDDRYGRNYGDLKGYFELRCNNIDNHDWDSEFGNTGNTILFQSPLENFKSFTNNEPMFISNFKISQNFLQDKLVFYLKIYDRNGDPFTQSNYQDQEINTNTTAYGDFQNAVNDLKPLNEEKDKVLNIQKVVQEENKENAYRLSNSINTLSTQKQKLINAVDNYINSGKPSTRNKIRAEVLKLTVENGSNNLLIYYFGNFLPLYGSELPYKTLANTITDYWNAYKTYLKNYAEKLQSEINETNINSSSFQVFLKKSSEFDPDNILIKSGVLSNVSYVVDVPLGTNKAGKIDVAFFYNSNTSTDQYAVVDIKPDSGSDNKLNKNDTLTIDKNSFEEITPSDFEYYFFKEENGVPKQVFITTGPGGNSNQIRYGFKVIRSNTTYDIEFLPDETKNFTVGDQIIIKGNYLGGENSTNDLKFTVDSLYTPQQITNYPFNDEIDEGHTDNGTYDITIIRDNKDANNNAEDPVYTFSGKDFTKTKNYSVGEEITIKGSKLDGVDVTNDAKLTVTEVNKPFDIITIDDTKSNHSIGLVIVNEDNSTVVQAAASTGTPPPPNNYEIAITSINGVYQVEVKFSQDFAINDRITILGGVLGGEDGPNDLELNVDSLEAGSTRIETISVVSGANSARYPTPFEINVSRKLNNDDYFAEHISGDFKVGDTIEIKGSELFKGKDTDNDLGIEVDKNVDNAFVLKTNGTANKQVGQVGEILSVDITGLPKKYLVTGRIEKNNITIDSTKNTPVTVAATATPDLKVLLLDDDVRSINSINTDLTSKYTEIETKQGLLTYVTRLYIQRLEASQVDKMKCMNMSIVLYDEVPEYSNTNSHHITGNTYSRLNNCQFKRI
jgi:hypothetical protein